MKQFHPHHPSFDARSTLSREEARGVYDKFADIDHAGGKDVSSGYGGPAIRALLAMAAFSDPSVRSIVDYGCGQGKLAELVLTTGPNTNTNMNHSHIRSYLGIDQSPQMIVKATERIRMDSRFKAKLLRGGDPACAHELIGKNIGNQNVDRFISTYCLDLLSEDDMYGVMDLAENVLHPERGLLLLAGITWGYKWIDDTGNLGRKTNFIKNIQTFWMTLLWEFLYIFFRRKVGGCRPQNLEPYLRARGWEIVDSVRTMPVGFPFMVSEVIAAKPPSKTT